MISVLFLAIFTFSIILEGIGIPYDRKIPLYILITLPIVLFVVEKPKQILIPKKLTLLWLTFLFFSLLSTIFSREIQISVEFLLFYASLGTLTLFIYNHKEQIEKYIIPLIFFLSIFFAIYSMLLPLLKNIFPSLTPLFGYQFVYPSFGSHNHLGDFLLLPLSICFYYILLVKNRFFVIKILASLFFLPYFYFSFSRSAYLSLIITLIIMVLFVIKRKGVRIATSTVLIITFTLGLSILFLFSVVKSENESEVTRLLTEKHALADKNLEGNRIEYLKQSALSILKNPLFGVGPGNFIYASQNNLRDIHALTYTAHNLYLEIFSENGILAGLVFFLLIMELFWRSKKNLYFYMAFALLLNFQLDYTYRIYSLFVLFLILLVLNYEPKSNFKLQLELVGKRIKGKLR